MVRFLGQTLPESKKVWVSLTKVYGIGYARARALCFAIGATRHTTTAELTQYHLSQLFSAVESRFTVGNDLRNLVRSNIVRLINIRSYRGMRHLQRLPVRGQRTHTNARTQKRRQPPSTSSQ